jgi:hypothetical protein
LKILLSECKSLRTTDFRTGSAPSAAVGGNDRPTNPITATEGRRVPQRGTNRRHLGEDPMLRALAFLVLVTAALYAASATISQAAVPLAG